MLYSLVTVGKPVQLYNILLRYIHYVSQIYEFSVQEKFLEGQM